MPKIIGQAEQQQAMRQISAGLKKLDAINQFLNNVSRDNLYTISLITPSEEKITAIAYSDSKDTVDQLVMNQRNRIIADITKMAHDNRIEFDERDYVILTNEPTSLNAMTNAEN